MNSFEITSKYESNHLIIRRYDEKDAKDVLDLYSKNFEALIESFPKTTMTISDLDSTLKFLKAEVINWNNKTRFLFGVWNKDNKAIGQLQLKSLNFEVPSVEIAYFVCKSHSRIGIATELLELILKSLFTDFGFKRVFARILPTNIASINLVNKLGFKEEGIHQNEFLTGDGKLSDIIYFTLLKSEYIGT